MKKMLLPLLVVMITEQCFGQIWNPNPAVNNAVCAISNTTTKNNLVTVSDGSGGMWLAWEDARNTATTGTDIYCQRINANGSLAFDANGIVVTNAVAGQTNISIVDDGAAGVILTWTDARTTATTSNDIYMQRIKSDGTIAYTANGIAVSNGTLNELGSVITRLNETECLVAWRDSRLGNADIYANKITISTGSKIFTSDSVIVNTTGTQQNIQLLADGIGGAFIIWEDQRVSSSRSSIYAQYINNTGVPQWQVNGIAVCDANASGVSNNRQYPKFVLDGIGGFVATWADTRAATTDNNIYAQRIAADGSAQWMANGIAICTATGNQTLPLIAKTGNLFFITWYDLRSGNTDVNVYAQAVALDATIQWDVNGFAVCTNTGNQPSTSTPSALSRNLNILTDAVDGVILIWDDTRNSATTGTDIYAQRIKADKTILWTANGVLISNATGNQASPVSLIDGSGGFFIAWQDGRTTANCEIYGSRVTSAGLLPVSFLSVSATAKTASVTVEWATASELNNSHFVVERSVDGTNFSAIATVTAKGTASTYTFNDALAVQGDNYYRIVSVDNDGSTQLSKTVKASLQIINSNSLQVYPNPTEAQTVVKLQGVASGKLQLKVIDAKGVLISSINTTAAELAASKIINLQALQNGVYVIQIVNASGDILTSKMILKY
ncbi:MAG: T9SS type A sorting domain-containing protein [Flavobacterium sp.]|nr:T9SS type A sorting domain-containing protein [Flavobacterium sp.]